MSETKRTHGPWEVSTKEHGEFVVAVNYPHVIVAEILGPTADARLIAAAPLMKGQLQTTIDALEAAIQLFIRKEDSEAFGALKGIIAGNEMALAKAEGQQ